MHIHQHHRHGRQGRAQYFAPNHINNWTEGVGIELQNPLIIGQTTLPTEPLLPIHIRFITSQCSEYIEIRGFLSQEDAEMSTSLPSKEKKKKKRLSSSCDKLKSLAVAVFELQPTASCPDCYSHEATFTHFTTRLSFISVQNLLVSLSAIQKPPSLWSLWSVAICCWYLSLQMPDGTTCQCALHKSLA